MTRANPVPMARARQVTLYTCDNCGKEAEWGPGWAVYYGGEKRYGRELHYYDPEPEFFACSPECQLAMDEKRGTQQ